jgi:hypothetical protein
VIPTEPPLSPLYKFEEKEEGKEGRKEEEEAPPLPSILPPPLPPCTIAKKNFPIDCFAFMVQCYGNILVLLSLNWG